MESKNYIKIFIFLTIVFLINSQNVSNNSTNTTIQNLHNLINAGDTAWVLSSGCLVMLMTPALGFFYGGLVKTKNMISILGQCFAIYSITSVTWTIIGFSLAFGNSYQGFFGGGAYAGLNNVTFTPNSNYGPTIPFILYFFFQTKFAVITPALIIGATAERVRFLPICIFSFIWTLLVYTPVAHWNWNAVGWLNVLGTKDFAGGNSIHISSGISALAIVLAIRDIRIPRFSEGQGNLKKEECSNLIHNPSTFLQKKKIPNIQKEDPIKEFEKTLESKNSLVFVVLGTMLIWFGWFGFNGGSALNIGDKAMLGVVNTNIAASASLLSWVLMDVIFKGRPTVTGMCIGTICGLVGITPAAGFVRYYASFIIGFFSSVVSYFFCLLRERYKLYDDRLDVFGCHGISGIWGGIATGLFLCDISDIDDQCSNNDLGAVYGMPIQLVYQSFGIISTISYCFVMSTIIMFFLKSYMTITFHKSLVEKGLDRLEFNEFAIMMNVLVNKPKETLMKRKKFSSNESRECLRIHSLDEDRMKFALQKENKLEQVLEDSECLEEECHIDDFKEIKTIFPVKMTSSNELSTNVFLNLK